MSKATEIKEMKWFCKPSHSGCTPVQVLDNGMAIMDCGYLGKLELVTDKGTISDPLLTDYVQNALVIPAVISAAKNIVAHMKQEGQVTALLVHDYELVKALVDAVEAYEAKERV